MVFKRHIGLFLLLLAVGFMPIAAQSMDALKKERKAIEERLKETDRLLKQAQQEEKSSLSRINILTRNLNDRKKLIENFNAEVSALETSLAQLEVEKIEMEKQLEHQKGEYANMVRKMQTNRNAYSSLMFVLSAKSFDQSVRRARYLSEFTDYRKGQVKKINVLQQGIQAKTDSLKKNKQAKLAALKMKESEVAKLQDDEQRERSLYAGLKKEEKNLLNQYKLSEQKKTQIDRKIQQVIEEEIRKEEERRRVAEARRKAEEDARRKAEEARQKAAIEAQRKAEEKRLAEQKQLAEQKRAKEKAAEAGKTTTPRKIEEVKPIKEEVAVVKPTTSTSTAKTASVDVARNEQQLLGGNFAANKGRLPWPVDRGVINGRFGKQPHPELRYVEINNKGTYFRSPPDTEARVVFEGVVTKVFSLPGSGSAVIVQHGNYRTIYANLSTVYVREGQQVKARQVIGKVYKDDSSGQSELLFQIYNDRNLVNPEAWISR